MEFKAKCSKCGEEFETSPGRLNSTQYLGEAGRNMYIPECPKCGNWRGNQLINPDGTLSDPLRT